MPHKIEIAKSGRATCRTCRSAIAKDTLRLGEEVTNGFAEGGETTFRWHHLPCAAKKHPDALREALAAWDGDVPDRASLDAALAEAEAKKPPPFPHADKAPTGRARCQSCGEAIAKGALRVAFEREIERGMTVTKGAGYVHPACAAGFFEEKGTSHADLTAALRANTRDLDEAELDALFAEV